MVHQDPKSGLHTKEFTTEFKLKGGPKSQEELEKYRNTWTKEDESNRSRRFQTTLNGPGLTKHGGLPDEHPSRSMRL